jgi:hypothetical protein
MAKRFENSGESRLISRIETSKELERRRAIQGVGDVIDPLSNAIANKLVENQLVETTNKTSLTEQLAYSLEKLNRADDFDIDFQIAPFRTIVNAPNVVSLYLTAFVIEHLIKHKDVIDIYGADDEIYNTIHKQVARHLSLPEK